MQSRIQITHAPSGASALLGTSFRSGNLVQLGSQGISEAVLFPERKSVTLVSLVPAVLDIMIDLGYVYLNEVRKRGIICWNQYYL